MEGPQSKVGAGMGCPGGAQRHRPGGQGVN